MSTSPPVRPDPAAGLAYVRQGSGPVVLLLHGQPGSHRVWYRVLPLLAGAGYTALAVDRPGYGRSVDRPYGFAGNAGAAYGLLDALGVRRAVIVAHSWAGGVALAMALRHPERVAGLVLAASVGGPGSVTTLDRLAADPTVGAAVVRAGLWAAGTLLLVPPVGRRLVTERDGAPVPPVRGVAAAWRSRRVARTVFHEQRALVNELAAVAGAGQLGRIDVPAVVVAGRRDGQVSPASQRALAAALPRARLVEVDCGHPVPVAAPREVLAAVRAVTGISRTGR